MVSKTSALHGDGRRSRRRARASDVAHDRPAHPAAILQRLALGPDGLTSSDVLQLQRAVGNRSLTRLLADIDHAGTARLEAEAADKPSARRAAVMGEDEASIRRAAQEGTQTPSSDLPYAEQIQRAFGRHDISRVEAHLGPKAASSAAAANAAAYAMGDHVVFGSAPDLHTAAHEAAHVVQQRSGLQLAGGVGKPGDTYEAHAEVVAQRVLAGRSAEGLLDRFADARGTAGQGEGGSGLHASGPRPSVQRLVKFNYATYLADQAPDSAKTKAYVEDFVLPEYQVAYAVMASNNMKGLDEFEEMKRAYLDYGKRLLACGESGQWAPIVAPLNALATKINAALQYAAGKLGQDVDSYSNKRGDSWADPEKALETMEALSGGSGLAGKKAALQPKGHLPGQPDIPGIKWSQAKGQLPSALQNLIRDIHTAWRLGQAMDERDPEAQDRKEKNPNVPGGLRSWHVNEQGQLPNISGLAVPAHAQALHTHYEQTGQHPYEKGDKSGPVGYAEYTGTGITNDYHYSKIVLDYKTGVIYVTVSHYQLWDKNKGKYEIKDKSPGSGTHSAWFYIDMGQ